MNYPSKKKILIIEDEGDLCFLLELFLNSKTTSIDHVRTLKEARESLKNENPDLVVLDNRLPDGFGMDFLQFIKNNYPHVRIIMMSGKDAAASDVAIESGAHVFLAKPFSREKLHASVQALLK